MTNLTWAMNEIAITLEMMWDEIKHRNSHQDGAIDERIKDIKKLVTGIINTRREKDVA